MDRPESLQGWWLHPAALAGAFVLALSAFLPDHLLFHPDERHYVDAGMQMAQTGDWLTPRTAEGELRLKKPVLPYWFVAAGCAVFGPSPFSTRLLFVLAGGGMVWLSWSAARQATGSIRAATLTALIVMCHPALLLSATRSLPDVVLSLFLTMSLAGFLGIIARGRADWGSLALAYGGGALAILSKGAPAAVFVLYATVFLVVKLRTLVLAQWSRFAASIAGMLVLGGSWFAAMHVLHGDVIGQQFVDDQAGSGRFAFDAGQILVQGLLCGGLLAASFGAALLPSLQTLVQRRRDAVAILDRPMNHFLIGWCVLFIAAAACINHVSLRYLLPLVSPLAVLLGSVLTELEGPALRRNLRWLAWASIALLLPAAGFAFVAMNTDRPVLIGAGALLLGMAGLLLVRQMRFTAAVRSVAVAALATQTALLVIAWGGQCLQGRSFGYQLADAVPGPIDGHGAQPLMLIGEPAHATRVRVCSGGGLPVVQVSPRDARAMSALTPVAALDPARLPALSSDVAYVEVPCGFHRIDFDELWAATIDGRLSRLLRERRREYTVAVPTPAALARRSPAASPAIREAAAPSAATRTAIR